MVARRGWGRLSVGWGEWLGQEVEVEEEVQEGGGGASTCTRSWSPTASFQLTSRRVRALRDLRDRPQAELSPEPHRDMWRERKVLGRAPGSLTAVNGAAYPHSEATPTSPS